MLHNRYIQAALAAALLLVIAYNVSFFLHRRDTRAPAAGPAAAAKAPALSALPPQLNVPPGSWKRDPFWYPPSAGQGVPHAGAPPKAPRDGGFHLEGTLTRDGKGYALINGRIVGVGERVGSYEIVAVGDSEITVRTGSGTKTIRLLGDTEGKE